MKWYKDPIHRKYVVVGFVLGLIFPVIGSIVQIRLENRSLGFSSLVLVQTTNPLLWIVDTAPFVIAYMAWMIGIQRRLVRTIKQGKEEWEAIFDSFSDLIFLTNEAGVIQRCNHAVIDRLNTYFLNVIGKPLYEVLRLGEQQNLDDMRKTEKDFLLYGRLYEIRTQKIEVDGLEPHRLYILHDITEQNKTQLEIETRRQYFESLVENSPAAIVVLDNEERIVSCNPAFEKLYGYSESEILDVKIDTLITTPDTLLIAKAYTQQALTGVVRATGRRRRKDGSLVDVQIYGVPVIVNQEKIGALAIYHDISELVLARQEAEQASLAKSDFLANMSHEIRTPMNGVIGMLELALDTQLTDEQRDYLQTSLVSAETLLVLLNDILDFSKIESGRLEIEKIDFNLRNTVEDVAYTLATRAQSKGLEMACLVQSEIATNLKGDPNRLRQVLINLAGNAIKFTHHGEIVIRTELLEETEQVVLIRFSVDDTGIGIPPERQNAIFDRFSQADTSTTRKYGGTGLGLAISRQLVEAMGGKIGLRSTVGVGSSFWFDLRFEKQPRQKPRTAPLVLQRVDLQSARILIVDDNQTNRMILIKMVEGFGCRVDTASTGSKGVELLRNAYHAKDPYHVVLLDMQMPGMDGEQTARAIKSDPSIKEAKIMILTSMGQRGDATRLEALGCSGYLLKPVKQRMLYDALVAVLGQKKEQSQNLVTRHILTEQRRFTQRLLLAEDNVINQKLAVALLQKVGFSVDVVSNGRQAVEQVRNENYAALLMDVQMPEMDGYEATRQIRAWENGTGGHLPIVAMTAHAMQGDRELCLQAGMDDYVTKPLEPKVLFSALDRWVRNEDTKAGGDSEKLQDYSAAMKVVSSVDADDGLFGEDTPAESHRTGEAVPVSQTISAADEIPVNIETALYRFGGDRNFMMEMLKEYKEHLPGRLVEINDALKESDLNRLSRLAHNLKGISLNFNANPVANAALALEEIGKNDRLDNAPALVRQLVAEIHRLEEYLSSNGV